MSLAGRASQVVFASLVISLCWAGRGAQAEPLLQLYLEGGVYDSSTESWYIAPPGSSAGEPFRLWVIGNTYQAGIIHDVRLSMAYAAEHRTADRDLTVTLSPMTANLISDPSLPTAPTFVQFGAAGTVPLLGDGSPLPAHGIFGANTVWQEWLLGDFQLRDSPLGDFVETFPTSWKANAAQVNVYDIAVQFSNGDSAHGVQVHFDVYNHVEGANHVKYKFAPFSHDADGTVDVVPAPPALVGLIGLGAFLPFGARRFLRAPKS
ncbi:choice-of-anchor N protein [Thermopirellula anaerolimosa]